MRTVLLVGLGGGLGSIFRYGLALFVNKHFYSFFPLATFLANIIGCFLIGFLLGLFERHQWTEPDIKIFFVVGFCGGFTTFSTFAIENVTLVQSNQTLIAFAYIAFSVLTGLLATWMGLWVVK